MRCFGRLNFASSKALEGQKRGVILGSQILVSPAIYSLLKGPEARETIASLELLEVEKAPADLKALLVRK